MKQPEGKYLLVKDPNKPVIRLYAIPRDTFEEGGEEGAYEEEEGEDE